MHHFSSDQELSSDNRTSEQEALWEDWNRQATPLVTWKLNGLTEQFEEIKMEWAARADRDTFNLWSWEVDLNSNL
jgi:hypothetical protein